MSFSLLPKQEKFYVSLRELTSRANLCAHFLKKYLDTPAAERKKVKQELEECRGQSKALMNDLTGELCRSFVTPFDREDIQNLAHYLYRIPKIIEKAVERMELHGLKGAEADFAKQVDLIIHEAEMMGDMVMDLTNKRNTKKLVKNVADLHDLEQRGDDVLQELLNSLYSENRDVRDLMLRKDIYDLLEKAIDCYRDAAAVTLQIVLKYS